MRQVELGQAFADRDVEIRCSFCNHAERDVNHIVGGPGVFICNNCIDMCLGIVLDQPDYSPHPYLIAAYRNRRVALARNNYSEIPNSSNRGRQSR